MIEKRFVEIVTYTWAKDSHGLFDYESRHLFTNNFKISGSAQFFRKNNNIYMVDPSSPPAHVPHNDPQDFLFEITTDSVDTNQFYISTANNNSLNNPKSVDLIVRAFKKEGLPSGYELKVGDIIKIGRVNFLVHELQDENGQVTKIRHAQPVNYHLDNTMEEEVPEGSEHNNKPAGELNCRICLERHIYPDPLDNILISPCLCKGSCEYVHLRCLKNWIDSKKSAIENSRNVCLSFNAKKLSCEICKQSLPYAVKLGDQEYDIIDIKRPQNTPYLILEKLDNGRETKGLFLVKASDQEIILGRGHTHHIIVSDISVSRKHSLIMYRDGKFLIFDNNSKFGTLIQGTTPIDISSEKTIVQCGKTVIILSLKKEEVYVNQNLKAPNFEVSLDSPQTSVTTLDQETANIIKEESENERNQRDFVLTQEEGKEDFLDSLEIQTQESVLIPSSKKIFKIIKDTKLENPKKNGVILKNNEGKQRGRRKN